ncbi:hypothetical protein ACFV1H_17740 [Streptomyces virginiae]|uniref:hypothetical protein n=1 Tax=Streptomyces virginiae TaxID=1961 RepID=UPI0036D0379D
MSEQAHRLTVSPAGMDDGVNPMTGEPAPGCDKHLAHTATAYLPHQCDQWVIGYGTHAEVIDSLLQLRTEVDAAITYLSKGPAGE